MRDPGDEDDHTVDRDLARALAPIRHREGRVRCFYPALRLPSGPDQDPGDEQPRLVNRYLYHANFNCTVTV